MYSYDLYLAGVVLSCRFLYPETVRLLDKYILNPTTHCGDVYVRPYEWDFWSTTGKPINAEAEGSLLCSACSDALLLSGRCLIHAAAISFHNQSWLITAPPGIGKSTQVRTLQALYPGEFKVICGDRPALQFVESGQFIVHPTPWNGKENWFGAPAAPLAGILCLERGTKTTIERLAPRDAVLSVFSALICSRETENIIRLLAAFEDALLKSVPVYRYVNGGVPDSCHFLYQSLFAKEGEPDEL